MRPIPPKLRKELSELPRMKMCVLAILQDVYGMCEGRIEWEHVWIYAERQVNEHWAIIGACHRHHGMKERDQAIKASFQTASLLLASEDDLAKYPRKNWAQIKRSLGMP